MHRDPSNSRNKSGTSSLFEATGVREDAAPQSEKKKKSSPFGSLTLISPCLDMSGRQRTDLGMKLSNEPHFSPPSSDHSLCRLKHNEDLLLI